MTPAIGPLETASMKFSLFNYSSSPQPAQPKQKGESEKKEAPKIVECVYSLAPTGLNILKYTLSG